MWEIVLLVIILGAAGGYLVLRGVRQGKLLLRPDRKECGSCSGCVCEMESTRKIQILSHILQKRRG